MPSRRDGFKKLERYELARSPLSQRPTQKELAGLLGETKTNLLKLVEHKNAFICRRELETTRAGKIKVRQLAYPEGRLRRAHEILKFHLNKVLKPDYIFSPRAGKSQRDNAAVHLNQIQILSFDLKQFYPSTTSAMVQSWLISELKMYPDVAALLTRLVTVDDKVSFGSPVTPVLCTFVHKTMFDRIVKLCEQKGLRCSVWVDDVVISGNFVRGDLLAEMRQIVRDFGLKSHKVVFRTTSKPAFITGIGVLGDKLVSPRKLNSDLKDKFEKLHLAQTFDEFEDCGKKLLTLLGTAKHISGKTSVRGMRAADQMNSIRQQIESRRKINITNVIRTRPQLVLESLELLPFDL